MRCNRLACALCSRLMLNLRDPKIIRYPTESGNAYGSPSSTEPGALTAVVMSDMTTFQTGAEQRTVGRFLAFAAVVHKPMSASFSRPTGNRSCATDMRTCVSIRILRVFWGVLAYGFREYYQL